MSKDLVKVDCGFCTACCRNQAVALRPDENPADYLTHELVKDGHVVHILQVRSDGSCVYLQNGGCSIHGRQPLVCREFSCVGMARKWRKMRRMLRQLGMEDDEKIIDPILAEGRRRLEAERRRPLGRVASSRRIEVTGRSQLAEPSA